MPWSHVVLLSYLAALGPADPRIEAELQSVSPDRGLALLTPGNHAGLEGGGWAAIVRHGQLVAEGTMLTTGPDQTAVRIEHSLTVPHAGDQVIVVPDGWVVAARPRLPETLGLCGTLSAVCPGARTGWIDIGRRHGAVPGDGFVVLREGIPLATARVISVQQTSSLVQIQPVVANLTAGPGDRVEAIWSPVRLDRGRVCVVVRAQAERDYQRLWLVDGQASEPAEQETYLYFHRAGRYAAQGRLALREGPLIGAVTVPGLDRQSVRPGDWGFSPPMPHWTDPLGYVFRVERDYVLVSTLQSGQVQLGQRLYARRGSRWVGELAVETVKRTFCGARVLGTESRTTNSIVSAPIALWDEVFVWPPQLWPTETEPLLASVMTGGQAIHLQSPRDIGPLPDAGAQVILADERRPVAAGVLLSKSDRQILVWAPRCWQRLPILTGMLLSCWTAPDGLVNARGQNDDEPPEEP